MPSETGSLSLSKQLHPARACVARRPLCPPTQLPACLLSTVQGVLTTQWQVPGYRSVTIDSETGKNRAVRPVPQPRPTSPPPCLHCDSRDRKRLLTAPSVSSSRCHRAGDSDRFEVQTRQAGPQAVPRLLSRS